MIFIEKATPEGQLVCILILVLEQRAVNSSTHRPLLVISVNLSGVTEQFSGK